MIKNHNTITNNKEYIGELINNKNNVKIGNEITVEKLVDKLNQIAETNASILVSSTGAINMPSTYYSKSEGHDWESIIKTQEEEDFIEEKFCICEYTDTVGDFRCDIEEIKSITHDAWCGYFLIKFKEDNIQVYIEYHDFDFGGDGSE